MRKWYCIKVQPGQEGRLAKKLQASLDLHPEYAASFGEILIPTENIVELRKGKKATVTRVSYAGYVFAQMDMGPELHYFIRELGKGVSLIGSKGEPTAIPEAEIETIRQQMASSVEKPKSKVSFDIDQAVRVIFGPFSNFEGRVLEVDASKSKVKVGVTIFGRSTPVELDFTHVEKL